ncbi:ATP-grasp domain-containing protein [Chimaeribacter arupi]|uniref:ATP-grasp domain-containing protein n=2 Tax=Yersiniaceae TaxID=1903411 RepID=A0A2N5EJB1_9GAMM|nr:MULTISPECIES: ATP-grasp domain-containing protein [Yersiniaceae]MBS0967786.1 ATP-grasp domain-containing protein [Nissabacter archeti]MDV5140772.1 ATP-grasp domain-containing protein [Chimaeribacter arupi]PLR39026.1 ATP-grasp domain-containing protein [Chimaeribacter arupi]PLR43926.1 ATP-grasp domain-containing protein [Chimaeribacter arupi]PLR45664.1 ATP-grasp domain-containing protein [Chimaeribacter arupi]
MKIVILHRIPFEKIRYDQILDHQAHDVIYFCLSAPQTPLPGNATVIVLAQPCFDAAWLAEHHAHTLAGADRLIARSEYDLMAAARLREHFAIPGDTPAHILPLRNKWVMRYRCKQQGIRQPAFWHPLEFLQLPPQPGKFLLKPREEASSNGIITGDDAAIRDAILKLDNSEKMMVETFIDGTVCHFDGWLSKGKPLAFVSSEYLRDCLSFSAGSPLGSVQTPTDPAHLALVTETLAALGYRDGSFHFEAIRDAGGRFWFLETAARVGGAGVAETFHLRTGLNLYHADLRYQIFGIPPATVKALNPLFYGWFVYPAHHLDAGGQVPFSAEKWAGFLLHYHHNQAVRAKGPISYAADHSPLSGVVVGKQQDLPRVINAIFNECNLVVTK